MENRTDASPRPTAEPGCRPWCALHHHETDACSSAAVDVVTLPGAAVWASQLRTDAAPLIAVDGYDSSGARFDLALTPAQALDVGALLQGVALLGGAA